MASSASNSWRLSVNEIDRSSTVRGEAEAVGAMVIRSYKGPVEPVKIRKGQEQKILNIFGTPSATYPDIWEAIQYNKQDELWISAPYSDDAMLGGVLVDSNGANGITESEAPAPDALGSWTFTDNTEYFALFAISPYSDDLGVEVSRNTDTGYFTINLYKTEDGGSTWSLLNSYTVSHIEGTKDGFGKNIYIEEVLEGNQYIQAVVNDTADVDGNGFTDISSIVGFTGGDRGSAITTTEINAAWDYFKKIRQYAADIFMDPTADEGIPITFSELRNSYQKYSFYIFPLPMGEDVSTAISTKEGYGVNNDGLAVYWNHARVKDTYNNSSFWTSLIGRVGAKLAQMTDIYNGGAPAWIDENGHGGQLGAGIIEMEYDPTEGELKDLDESGVNPIVQYPGYGTMIVSQRTMQSPNNLSDTSWIAHRRLFDYIISNVLDQVLTYQIVKLNDELHRRLAISKGTTILDPVVAENLLSEYVIQCDLNNNDGEARAQRKFVYTIGIKVNPYSENIVLNFVNVNQQTDIEEVIG